MQTTAPAPQGAPTTTVDRVAGVLRRAAIALNSPLALADVLDLLTREILANTAARRASVLLCQPTDDHPDGRLRLEPAVSAARTDDPTLLRAFRQYPTLALDGQQRTAFAHARAIEVPDAHACDLVPDDWVDRFDLASMVLVPLFADGHPRGLLAVDFPPCDGFDPTEVALLESLAEVAGVSIRNATLYEAARERARLGTCLSEATAALAPPLDRATIAERLASSMRDLLQAEVAAVGFLDRDGWLRPLAIAGDWPVPEAMPLADVPDRIVEPVARGWGRGVARACELGRDPWLTALLAGGEGGPPVEQFVLLPLLADEVPAGAVLVGLRRRDELDDGARTCAETLASIGGTALERRALLRDQQDRIGLLEDELWLAATELGPTAARDLPSTLLRMRDVLADVPDLAVTVRTSRRHVRLPLAVERALYRVVREVLAGLRQDRARRPDHDGNPAAVDVDLRVHRRRARLAICATDDVGWHRARVVDADVLAAILSPVGGSLDEVHATDRDIVVAVSAPRHLPEEITATRHTPSEHAPYGLTSRELEILRFVAHRLTNAEIAQRLSITVDTVKTHVHHVLDKLGASDRIEAGQRAVEEGLGESARVGGVAQRSIFEIDDTDGPVRQGGQDATARAPSPWSRPAKRHDERGGVTRKTTQRPQRGRIPESTASREGDTS